MKPVLILFFLFFSINSFSQGGFLVKPSKVEFHLGKGQTATAAINVSNKLNEAKQFKIYFGDWLRDSVGGHRYMNPGSNGFSCAGWLKADQEFIEVKPGEVKVINLKLTLPDSAGAVDQMRWAMLFIETVDEQKAPAVSKGLQAMVQQTLRMGIHVYQTPPSLINKDVRMLSFDSIAGVNSYRIECQNTGDLQLECKSYLELVNLESGVKTKLDYPEFPMFPRQKRLLDFTLPSTLPKGKYQVLAAVDAGEDVPLEAAEKIISIH